MKMTLYITAQFLALILLSRNSLIYKGFQIHSCNKKQAFQRSQTLKCPGNLRNNEFQNYLQGIIIILLIMSSIPYHAVELGLAHPLGSHATIKNKI